MDEVLCKKRGIFFNNLVLLGLKPSDYKRKYGIPFHKDMFNSPNKKGYEVLTHFLFTKLSEATGNDYNLPWPLLSKEHERRFKETCCAHFNTFAQENEVSFPLTVRSLLSTYGGDRFYKLYFAFSCYVLKKVVRKNENVRVLSRPRVTEDNAAVAKQVLQLATIRSRNAFVATVEATHAHDVIAVKYANNLSLCLQKLRELLTANFEELKRMKKEVSEAYSVNPEDLNVEHLVDKCIELWKPAKKQRQSLEQFFSTEAKLWDYMGLDGGRDGSQVLNGQGFDLERHENLPSKFHLADFSSCKQEGKLSVLRFLQFFLVHLKATIDILNAAKLQDFHETLPTMDASPIEEDLKSINNFNKKLTENIIPELEERIKKFQLSVEDPEETLEVAGALHEVSYLAEAVKERKPPHSPHFEERLHSILSEDASNSDSALSFGNVLEENSRFSNLASSSRQYSGRNDSGVDSSIPKPPSEEENLTQMNNNAQSPSSPASTSLGILNLDDSNLGATASWGKESWLLEESLDAMTLPDASFDD